MAANSQHRCVFVGNIPYDASEEQLIQICEEVGPVVSFRLVIDRETGKPKGYGFCEYKDEETALSARRNLQGYEINGRQLRVDFAENDKGTDRNREQGRGGPGFTSSVDAQRPLGGPAVLGDSSLYQSIGIPLAATAASVMAGALGGVQTDSVSAKSNGLQGQSGLGGDPLTHYLANMSRKHLFDIMSEMKVLTTQNRELAHQLLSSSPQLTKAIFQAQIMLGMVSPQVLQMPNIRQPSDSLSQPLLQDAIQDHKPGALPPHPGQTSLQNKMQIGMMPRGQEGQFSSAPQNASINNQPLGLPFQQMPPHPRFPHPLQAQNQHLPQTTQPVQPGASTVPSIRPFNGFTLRPQPPVLEPSITFKPNMQVPSFHNPRPDAAGSIGHDSKLLPSNGSQHTLLPRTSLPQPSFQPGSSTSMLLPGVAETVNKHSDRSAQIADDKTWIPRNNAYPIMPVGMSDKPSLVSGALDPTNRPSKLARLEDGRSAIWPLSQNPSTTSRSEAIPVFGAGSLPADQIPSTEAVQHSDKRVSELQLAPEEESALLQQVMSLTPEQLSSLPPEQRQQVIQLQQMFLR